MISQLNVPKRSVSFKLVTIFKEAIIRILSEGSIIVVKVIKLVVDILKINNGEIAGNLVNFIDIG